MIRIENPQLAKNRSTLCRTYCVAEAATRMFRHPRVGQAELGIALPVFEADGFAIKTRDLQQHAVVHAVAGACTQAINGTPS